MRGAIGIGLLCCVFAPALHAQRKFPPDSFTNLKVLPKEIGKQELIATLRGFALGLGVRCTYCTSGERARRSTRSTSPRTTSAPSARHGS